MNWQPVSGTIMRGHRVASGLNGDPRFPRNSHVSEKPLAIADNDLVIENTGTTNDLFRRVDNLMARISGFAMAYPAREA